MDLALDAPATWPPAVLPAQWVAPQGITVLRAASAVWCSGAYDDPPSTPWPARLLGDVEIGQNAMDAIGLGGRVALGLADIELWDADRALADLVRYGTADGRRVTIRTAAATSPRASHVGTPTASLATAFVGIVRSVDGADSKRAVLSCTDVAERLATPLQATRYLGSGGLEGPASLAGRPKPIALGRCYNVLAVALGNLDLGYGSLPTYQTSWRAITAHDAVRIRGVAQSAVGGTPSVGQYVDIPASGVFQLGSTPDGAVTADLRGDSVPIYVSSHSTVLRRLVQALGPAYADSEIQSLAFDFADTDLPGEMGWYRGPDEISASDAVAQILAGAGAVMAGGRGGLLRLFDPLAVDVDQFTLPAAWIISLKPLPLPAGLRPLPSAVTVDWRHNWYPMADVAGSVTDAAQLAGGASGPARSTSTTIIARVAQQRDMRLPGLYWEEADALARADKWRAFLEAGPRVFELVTDRYLGQIECGDIGRVAYPAHGLAGGSRCVVAGWREQLGGRRLTLTICTLPES